MAKNDQEAHVRGAAPPELDDAEVDEHGLTVLKVSQSDAADPDLRHAGPKKLGLDKTPFDPNAALRKKMGVGPGLQDSEALRPAVWVDQDSDEARKASADALEADAQRAFDRAKAEADAIRKGEPF
jgi:hypothetical protein